MSAYPLSPLQLARWSLARREPRFPWSCSLTMALRGPLDAEALRAAFARAGQRHEILRTRFLQDSAASTPGMAVEARGQAVFELHDWSALGRVERERECRRLEQNLRSPYPLDGATPLSAALARIQTDEHVLVLAQSALAADWRSLWNLALELVGELAGERPDEAPVQFADLAQWLSETHLGEDGPAGLAHWRRVPLAAAAELELPLEHVRPGRPLAFHEVARELAPALEDALAQLAQGRGLPREALLCAAWQAWLARLAERAEVVLGVRGAGRAFQGLEHALGTFERCLPVFARLDERTSLVQLARRTDEELAHGAEWHEHFDPAHLGAPADFAFPYAFEHLPRVEPKECGGLHLELLRRDGHGEAFRGLLRVEEGEAGSELRFAVDARRLGEDDAAALADGFLGLLEGALARPDAPLVSVACCHGPARARVLALARGPELAPEARSVHVAILETARARPEAVAVVAGGHELSYAALAERSAALAVELEELGVGPGELVGVHLERSCDLVVALLAVLRAGGAYVPLPPSYPRERLLATLEDAHARVLIGSATSASELAVFRGARVLAGAPRPTPARAPHALPTLEDLAYVIYTSGSSGRPKGVPITHGNLAASNQARSAYYAERVGRYLLLSSFAFDSSVAGIFWTLTQGGTLVLPPEGIEKDLASLPGLIARERVTHLLGLPSLWSLVLEQARAGELDSLTTVIVAGESCLPELVRRHAERVPRARLFNEYGPTEGTVWSTVFDARQPCERARVPIGRPIPGAANYVLTPERELAPIGLAGELWIGGPGVARGYLGRPELTAERFAEDPFSGGRMYRTGDRARLLSDGNLEFLGRLDQQVKIRGYRIELEEIEAVLSEHPAVREAIVVARTDAAGAPRLVAYVVPIGPRPAETDLVRFLAERLPEYMLPARAVCLDAWPQLPNGKIDRKALPAPAEAAAFAPPEGALETVLAALWCDVLGLEEEVGRNDDFFALGGHSLSATRLYARLKETLQVALPLRALFEHRTPAALAHELRRDPVERARVERLAEVVLAVLESSAEEQALGA
jgi:amino acid adenylation domain-containing protein